MVDAYVDELELGNVVNRHHLRVSRDPNVVLRVVPSFTDRWARPHIASVSAVALDLLDDPDPRAREVAEQALAKLGG
jgi:hypothetical protein